MRALHASLVLVGLLAACHSETCDIEAEEGPWGHYLMRDLPSGACKKGAPTCTVQTKDSCAGDKPGPRIDWKCTCSELVWSCQEFARGAEDCVPVSPPEDGGASEVAVDI